MRKIISVILIFGVMALSLTGCGKSDLEDAEKDLQEAQEKYGWVEKETVDTLVARFNTQVVDNSSLNPASDDYLTERDNQYWYGLIEGIYLEVVPEEYTGDKTSEIVNYMLLYAEMDLDKIFQMSASWSVAGIITVTFAQKDYEKLRNLVDGCPVVGIDTYGKQGADIYNI